jgi:hypothetical protein
MILAHESPSVLDILRNLSWVTWTKWIATFFTFLYGLYATVTDFHIKDDGKPKLTSTGKKGIAFLCIVAMISWVADAGKELADSRSEITKLKDEKDRLQDEQTKYETLFTGINNSNIGLNSSLHVLQGQTESLNDVLYQAERIRRPLSQMTMSYELTFSTDRQELQGFMRDNRDIAGGQHRSGCNMQLLKTKSLQADGDLSKLFRTAGVKVAFYRHPINLSSAFRDTQYVGYQSENYVSTNDFQLLTLTGSDRGRVHLVVEESKMDRGDDNGSISDLPTLAESYAYITIEPSNGELANAIWRYEHLVELVINIGDEHYAADLRRLKWGIGGDGNPFATGRFSAIFQRTSYSTTNGVNCE